MTRRTAALVGMAFLMIAVVASMGTAATVRDRMERQGPLMPRILHQQQTWATWEDGLNSYVYQGSSPVSTHILFTDNGGIYDQVITAWRIYYTTMRWDSELGWRVTLIVIDRQTGNAYPIADAESGQLGGLAVNPRDDTIAYSSWWTLYTQDVTDLANPGEPREVDGDMYNTAGNPYWESDDTLLYDFKPQGAYRAILSADVSDPENPIITTERAETGKDIWGPSKAGNVLVYNCTDGWIYIVRGASRAKQVAQGFFAQLDPASRGRRIVYQTILPTHATVIGEAVDGGRRWFTRTISSPGMFNPGFLQP